MSGEHALHPRLALVIHVTSLKNPLSSPKLDADAVRRTLHEKGGFSVTVVENPDREALRKSFDEFQNEVTKNPECIAVLHYSGHGVVHDGVHYIVPHDWDFKSSKGLEGCEWEGEKGALSTMRNAYAGIAFFDACRTEFKFDDMVIDNIRRVGYPNLFLSFACTMRQMAWDLRDKQPSLFTRSIVEHLCEPRYKSVWDAIDKAHDDYTALVKQKWDSAASQFVTKTPDCIKPVVQVTRSALFKEVCLGRGQRVLCLDDVRSEDIAAPLAVLKTVEEAMGRPLCKVFDVMVGSGIGGVMAMLLGLLGYTVNECKEACALLSSKRDDPGGVLSRLFPGLLPFSPNIGFQNDFKGTVGKAFNEMSSLPPIAGQRPSVIVVVNRVGGNGVPYKFANFCNDLNDKTIMDHVPLWKAAAATTANPGLHAPVQFGEYHYYDGGFLFRNPIQIARLLMDGPHFGGIVTCYTSVGSERVVPSDAGGPPLIRVVRELLNAASASRHPHDVAEMTLTKGEYFRFNIFSDGAAGGHDLNAKMTAIQEQFQCDERVRIDLLVKLLQEGCKRRLPSP